MEHPTAPAEEVVMPTHSADVTPMAKNTKENSKPSPRSSANADQHALAVVEITELTKRIALDGPAGQDKADTAKNNNVLQPDNDRITKIGNKDAPTSSKDAKPSITDTELAVTQQKDDNSTQLYKPDQEVTANKALITRRTDLASDNIPDLDYNTTTVDTIPVPYVYPPRRPNIFKKRGLKRAAARPVYVWSKESGVQDIIDKAAKNAEDGDDDGEEFTAEDLKDIQSAQEEYVSKKTEAFKQMVSQHCWQTRKVVDLGEAFALED
ncbi:hypothetical protein B0T20DRAFT_455621 [Sordaria brevicollis]|uniref:Uncharacterized protein n=1 Tax=Sordaria brevicollis TaxID=83679 RepID=A0AAE0P9F9_SORBR|nr:hypothetical protein B0T20DRAFT_455621 [Sordaria brevicollis]